MKATRCWWICFIWILVPPGSCYITINPMNVTTCWNSSANFSCAITETKQIYWEINGRDVVAYNVLGPITTFGQGADSTLTLPGLYELEGVIVTCNYNANPPSTSLKLYSIPAFLRVQGPPLNLTATLIGNRLIQLSWIPSNGRHIGSFLEYLVLIKDGNGTAYYNETVRNSQLIINTTDPCAQYEATVTPLCQGILPITSIGKLKIPGVPPSAISKDNIAITLKFPHLLQHDIILILNISILQPGVCAYIISIASELGEILLPSVLPTNGKVPYIFSLSLQPNQNFNITIIASNAYGNASFSTSASTHSVVGVSLNTTVETKIQCIFNPDSHGIGCFINLTNLGNGITYCIVLQRFLNSSERNFRIFESCNQWFGAGMYLLKAYDIDKDGNISKLPAVTEEVLLETSATIVPEPSFPTAYSPAFTDSRQELGIVVIGISSSIPPLLILILIAVAICFCTICKKKVRIVMKKYEVKKMPPIRLSGTSKPQSPSINDEGHINLECCLAYNDGSSEPMKLTQNDFNHYKIVFIDMLVNSNQLTLDPKPIGEGAFGVVYGATLVRNWDHEAVAVKTVKELYSRSDMEQFFDECCRMKAFKHPNVVELIGMCLDSPDGFPLMILPLYPHGNVKLYLQKRRRYAPFVTTLPEGLSTSILITMCLDIAQGMEYLAEKGFVHRDLAARNCMVDLNLCVKVGDFGFTREASYLVSHIQKCPVKWMPPEMLQDGISSEKSDVWAYGVTCWEIFSLGANPYPGVANHEMLELLFHGLRLKIPTMCPENMFKVIECCWNSDPARRPSFLELVTQIQEVIAQFTNEM